MTTLPRRFGSGHRRLALLFAALSLALLRGDRTSGVPHGAPPASAVVSAAVATSHGLAAAGGRTFDLAVASALNGGTQLVELATRITRLAGSDSGGYRNHAAGAAGLQLHRTVRSELNYLTSLLRRRSGADPGYTSTPPPATVRT